MTDADSGRPVKDAAIQIHSEGGLFAERDRKDFSLTTGPDGTVKRLCRDCMCFGTRSLTRDTFVVHLPWWRA